MNQFQKSQSDRIKSCYSQEGERTDLLILKSDIDIEEDNLEKGGTDFSLERGKEFFATGERFTNNLTKSVLVLEAIVEGDCILHVEGLEKSDMNSQEILKEEHLALFIEKGFYSRPPKFEGILYNGYKRTGDNTWQRVSQYGLTKGEHEDQSERFASQGIAARFDIEKAFYSRQYIDMSKRHGEEGKWLTDEVFTDNEVGYSIYS